MSMYSYERYLSAKKSVDDRALHRGVCDAIRMYLSQARERPWRILEVGGGIGTMAARLMEWQLLGRAEYTIVDENAELLAYARRWLADWAAARGAACEVGADGVAIRERAGADVNVHVRFVEADVRSFLLRPTPSIKADLLIANAFLDLVELPATLAGLFTHVDAGGMYWLTINYDGETIFLPEHRLDGEFLRVYNRSMDDRRQGAVAVGDSKTGRHLFRHLQSLGTSPTVVGASDWVVHPVGKSYPADEAHFLGHIVNTVEEELRRHPNIARADLAEWSGLRHQQIARAELVYIAHQLDFAGTVGATYLGDPNAR